MKEKEELLKELDDKNVIIDNLHKCIHDICVIDINFYKHCNRIINKCNTFMILFYITFILLIISILMLIFI